MPRRLLIPGLGACYTPPCLNIDNTCLVSEHVSGLTRGPVTVNSYRKGGYKLEMLSNRPRNWPPVAMLNKLAWFQRTFHTGRARHVKQAFTPNAYRLTEIVLKIYFSNMRPWLPGNSPMAPSLETTARCHTSGGQSNGR